MSDCEHIKEKETNPNKWKYWRMQEFKRVGKTNVFRRVCIVCGTTQTKRAPAEIIDLDNPQLSQGPTRREAWIGIKKKVT